MTSSDQNSRDPRRDEVIAGEYVLGVLSAEDRRKVEDRLRSDHAFAAMVSRWEENLLAINQELGTLAPASQAYPTAERHLSDAPTQVTGSTGLWQSLAFWRSVALASLATSIGLLVFGSDLLAPPAPQRRTIAELSGSESPVSLVVHYEPARGMLSLTPAAAKRGGPKTLQLWLLDEGGPPVSLGVLPASGEGTLIVPENRRSRLSRGALLAVSVEPVGGSPTGTQTGPVIASGSSRPF